MQALTQPQVAAVQRHLQHKRCRHAAYKHGHARTATAALPPGIAVSTSNVWVEFGSGPSKRSVLQGVDLQIQRGSLHMLLGPNGCGKSTLLKALGGLVPVAQGELHTDVPTGFVFQNPDHQVVMPTVAADVAFGLGRYEMEEQKVAQAVATALELVHMGDAGKRATHTLSGGQRQRVAIAGALAENPRLLLLDELTTFLDVNDQFGVLEAIHNITRRGSDSARIDPAGVQTQALQEPSRSATGADNGGGSAQGPDMDSPVTAIWVTHRFEELRFADAATYMRDGRVVFTGSPDEMRLFLRQAGAPL